MTTFQHHKRKVLQLFQTAIAFATSQNQPTIQQRLQEAADYLAAGKLFVVVCGEFKQGKSSLLNALLHEQNLFPVDVDITTNLISTITYADQEEITVVLGEAGQEQTRVIQRQDIPDYVTEQRNQHNLRQAKILSITAPNPQLREGLVLVDTPGVGSLNVEHTALSYAFIPNADAILFVSDALSPLSSKELNFIQERILPHCKNLIFVVTKIDAVQNYDAIIESNREKLAQVLECSPQEVLIIPVSSALKLEFLRSQDPEDLEDSNFTTLEQTLWQMISEQRGQLLLLRALSELGRSLAEIEAPLQAEREACQQHSQQELNQLEWQSQETRGRLQNLLENSAAWRTELSNGLLDIREQVLDRFQRGMVQVKRRADDYLNDGRRLSHPEQIVGLLEADIDGLMAQLEKELSQQAAELHGRIEDLTGLNLNPFEVEMSPLEKLPPALEASRFQKSQWWGKALTATRSGMFNSSAGSTVGGLLGGFAGGFVGLLLGGVGVVPGAQIGAAIGLSIGGIAGFSKGVREGLSQVKDKGKREVAKLLKPFLEDSQQYAQKALKEGIKSLERSMQEELIGQLRRQKDTWERALQSVQDARKLSQAQANQRVKEVQTLLQQLNPIQQSAAQLAKAALTIATLPSQPDRPAPNTAQSLPATAAPQKQLVTADYGDWADD